MPGSHGGRSMKTPQTALAADRQPQARAPARPSRWAPTCSRSSSSAACTTQTRQPGQGVAQSEEATEELLAAVAAADLVVLSFPLYVDSLPAPVDPRARADRRLARGGRARRPGARRAEQPAFVAICQSGFPEVEHNEVALEICRNFARCRRVRVGRRPCPGRRRHDQRPAAAQDQGDDALGRHARSTSPPRRWPPAGRCPTRPSGSWPSRRSRRSATASWPTGAGARSSRRGALRAAGRAALRLAARRGHSATVGRCLGSQLEGDMLALAASLWCFITEWSESRSVEGPRCRTAAPRRHDMASAA